MCFVTFALLFLTWAGIACLIFNRLNNCGISKAAKNTSLLPSEIDQMKVSQKVFALLIFKGVAALTMQWWGSCVDLAEEREMGASLLLALSLDCDVLLPDHRAVARAVVRLYWSQQKETPKTLKVYK